jgi:hypothetical protein
LKLPTVIYFEQIFDLANDGKNAVLPIPPNPIAINRVAFVILESVPIFTEKKARPKAAIESMFKNLIWFLNQSV